VAVGTSRLRSYQQRVEIQEEWQIRPHPSHQGKLLL
jgi:hypothetical protein